MTEDLHDKTQQRSSSTERAPRLQCSCGALLGCCSLCKPCSDGAYLWSNGSSRYRARRLCSRHSTDRTSSGDYCTRHCCRQYTWRHSGARNGRCVCNLLTKCCHRDSAPAARGSILGRDNQSCCIWFRRRRRTIDVA